jgi:Ala-tRNA(Pro) deacylase
MSARTPLDRPNASLLAWLAKHKVDYDIHEHPRAFTAPETARAEGVHPRTFAKVVGVRTHDGRTVLLVLDATDHVDLHKARRALDSSDVRLLDEGELAALAPDCDVGALPAVGRLFGLGMVADHAVRQDPEISFNAGSHRYSVRVDRASWERACGVYYADLAVDTDTPAWAGA